MAKKNMREIGEVCKGCGITVFTKEMIEERRRLKSKRISEKRLGQKAQGVTVGVPRQFDYEEIRFLKSKGFSMREIAVKMGCSTSPVTRALKEEVYDLPKKRES